MLSREEQDILRSIDAWNRHTPSFPATPTVNVEVPHFSNVWVKDESIQDTGTHKDRMAWEVMMAYYEMLKAKEAGRDDRPLPHLSIISAGSAALALQTQFKRHGLPALKILVDEHTNPMHLA